MDELKVVVQTIAQKELALRRDPGVDKQLIFLCNPHYREMPYAVNVAGGRVIIGLDRNRFLNNLEIIRPKAKQTFSMSLEAPTRVGNIGIQFPNITKRHVDLDISISISAGEESAVVSFGENMGGEWMGLSDSLWVRISEDELRGFFVRLR